VNNRLLSHEAGEHYTDA